MNDDHHLFFTHDSSLRRWTPERYSELHVLAEELTLELLRRLQGSNLNVRRSHASSRYAIQSS